MPPPPNKTQEVIVLVQSGQLLPALKIASKFKLLPEEQKITLSRAWAAHTNPQFYLDIKQNPDELVLAGFKLLAELYGSRDLSQEMKPPTYYGHQAKRISAIPTADGYYGELKVCRSNAGFYIGRDYVYTSANFASPGSRESTYYKTEPEAKEALKSGSFHRVAAENERMYEPIAIMEQASQFKKNQQVKILGLEIVNPPINVLGKVTQILWRQSEFPIYPTYEVSTNQVLGEPSRTVFVTQDKLEYV